MSPSQMIHDLAEWLESAGLLGLLNQIQGIIFQIIKNYEGKYNARILILLYFYLKLIQDKLSLI